MSSEIKLIQTENFYYVNNINNVLA